MEQKVVGIPNTLKKVNESAVLSVILATPQISQPEISVITGLSLQTINKIVTSLEKRGRIACCGLSDSTGGRRAKVYSINEKQGYFVCVYIQENIFYGSLNGVNEKAERFCEEPKDLTKTWTQSLLCFLEKLTANISKDTIKVVGVAVPGTITNNTIYNIPAIPEWESVNLQDILAQHYSCPVCIENDINVAALGLCSDLLNHNDNNMVYISILENIGSAIILDRKVHTSRNAFAGELSYMVLNDSYKLIRRKGSADAALSAILYEKDTEKLCEFVAKIAVNISCIIDPDMVIIATPYLTMQDVGRIKDYMSSYILKAYIPSICIVDVRIKNNLNGIFNMCKEKFNRALQIVKV